MNRTKRGTVAPLSLAVHLLAVEVKIALGIYNMLVIPVHDTASQLACSYLPQPTAHLEGYWAEKVCVVGVDVAVAYTYHQAADLTIQAVEVQHVTPPQV
jgi:hypothetical protein